MDALLTALMACFLVEMGDRSQMLALILAARYRNDAAILCGLAVAAFANAALSAAGGWFISGLIASNARALFMALGLLFAGGGLLLRPKQPDPLSGWRIGAFLTSALGLFILGFGDGAQFLVMGIAARTADPVTAAIGGGAGIFLASLPVVLMRQSLIDILPMRWIRLGGAALFLVTGTIMALGALQLL